VLKEDLEYVLNQHALGQLPNPRTQKVAEEFLKRSQARPRYELRLLLRRGDPDRGRAERAKSTIPTPS